MKKTVVILALLLAAAPALAQEVRSVEFLESLDGKDAATYADAVTFMSFVANGSSGGFAADEKKLAELGIVRETTGKQRGRIYAYSDYLALLDRGTEPLRA